MIGCGPSGEQQTSVTRSHELMGCYTSGLRIEQVAVWLRARTLGAEGALEGPYR